MLMQKYILGLGMLGNTREYTNVDVQILGLGILGNKQMLMDKCILGLGIISNRTSAIQIVGPFRLMMFVNNSSLKD